MIDLFTPAQAYTARLHPHDVRTALYHTITNTPREQHRRRPQLLVQVALDAANLLLQAPVEVRDTRKGEVRVDVVNVRPLGYCQYSL